MYSVLFVLILVCGTAQLEEVKCKVENLTVTSVSATSLTVAWARSPLKACHRAVVFLNEALAFYSSLMEVRVIRFKTSVTFADLDPCRHYSIDFSAMAHDGKMEFHQDVIIIKTAINRTRFFVVNFKEGIYVYNTLIGDKYLIAKNSSVNSKCYAISKPTGTTNPFLMQSTSKTNSKTNSSTFAGATHTIIKTSTLATTTSEKGKTKRTTTNGPTTNRPTTNTPTTNRPTTTRPTTTRPTTNRPTTTRPSRCTVQNLSREVESIKVVLTSATSVLVSWPVPACPLGLYMVSLSYDGRLDVREVRLVLRRNSAHLLGLEECHTYTVSVTPLTAESVWEVPERELILATRISRDNAVDVITSMKSNDTVSNLTVGGITTSSVEVSWTSPPHRSCHDHVHRFYVEVEHNGSDTAVTSGRSQSTRWDRLHLAGLEPCAAYRVSVIVGFVGGYRSTERSSIVVMTLPDKIRNLTAANVTVSSILLSWAAPAYWDCGAEKSKYLVKLESSPTKSWHIDTNSMLLSGLEPCTSHEISVSLYFVGEVDPKLKTSIVVHTLSDSLTACVSANFVSTRAAVITTVSLSTILIAVIVLVVFLRRRGLTLGRRRWRITHKWCVVRETIRARVGPPQNKVTPFQESSVDNKTREHKARTL